MQDLATTNNVRFLVENAGSMGDVHYQAFCTLLGIPSEPRSDYLWDPADYGYGITRKRNFFRAHTDRQSIQESRQLRPKQGGPLIAKDGRPITLPPLLRSVGHRGRYTNPVRSFGTMNFGEALTPSRKKLPSPMAKYHRHIGKK